MYKKRMSLIYKSFTNNVPSAQIAEIYESEIVTDNISAIDGSVTFINNVDFSQNVSLNGNNINNVDTINTTNLNSNTGVIDFLGNAIDMNGADFIRVNEFSVDSIGARTSDIRIDADLRMNNSNINMDTEDILNATNIDTSNLNTDVLDTNDASFITIPASMSIVGFGEEFTITSGNDLVLSNRDVDNTSIDILCLDSSDRVVTKDISTFSSIFGSEYDYAESRTVTSATSTVTYINKVTLTTGTIPAGTYRIEYSCLTANSNNGRTVELRFQEDGVNLNTPLAHFSGSARSEEFNPNYQFFDRILTSASYTYTLDFRPSSNTGRISDANISIYRIL